MKKKIMLIVNVLLILLLVVIVVFIFKENSRLQEIKELQRISYEFDDRQKECEIIGLSNKYVYVTRKNENDEPLVGAKWKVTKKDGTEDGTFEINENGNGGLIGLENGEYYVEEISVPEGYTIRDYRYHFFVTELDTSFTINESDKRANNIIVLIVKDKDGNPAQDVKYNVYNSNKEFVKLITTNEKGLAGVQNVPDGLYYIEEADKKNSEMFPVSVKDDVVEKIELIYEAEEEK